MAIALDATSSGSGENTASPLTVSHIVGSGSNRLLLVAAGASTDVVTGITYAAVAMTQLIKLDNGGQGFSYIYGLLSPATGTADIVMSWSGGAMYPRLVGVSYTGVRQTGLPDATASQFEAGSVTTLTTNVTTVATNTWILMVTRGANALTASTNQTLRGAPITNFIAGDTNANQTPAGSKSMTTTMTPAGIMGEAMVSFADVDQPVVAAGNRGYSFFM